MALILVPEAPVSAWLSALDAQMERAAGYFAQKPVVVNFSALADDATDPTALLYALDMRGLAIISVEGLDRSRLSGTRFETLPDLRQKADNEEPLGRELALPEEVPRAEPVPAVTSLLIDRPVRSGQSIIFEHGDVTILGALSSGAEVIAGGSVHVYGPLRGRVIAGVKSGAKARIFCRKLGAELAAIDGVYSTADDWNKTYDNCAVQIWLSGGALKISALG
ncbi:cell division inhibitor/septum site-determining protein MinC [Acidocella aminolytica 101 = DSM 11237]|uniref:Probable septum site-determining protein MinC n=2 Tax=Acidocella TaxID=50709 RepID=A0A0D6PH40_9PROT|nr:cell division inhibitor/septum site-determining protein MinC [Acidocella aminolytica 101 = DSM 11237]